MDAIKTAALRLCALLRVRYPLIGAPMAGVSSPALCAAVSKAGGLGSLGLAFASPEQVKEQCRAVREQTSSPFNVNFFAHIPPPAAPALDHDYMDVLQGMYNDRGAGQIPIGVDPAPPFTAEHLEAVLEELPAVVSFHFGLPAHEFVEALRARGCVVVSSCTTVEEAIALEEGGADVIVAQGHEAGGHRGTFLQNDCGGGVGSLSLIPQVADAVSVPVVAAGGIADGRGIAAALVLGASGVQIGTALIASAESIATKIHRDAVLRGSGDDTRLTRAFSGKPARGIENEYMRRMKHVEDATPPFPIPNVLSGPLRAASAREGDASFTTLWAGQSVSMTQSDGAGEIVERIMNEADSLVPGLATR